MHGRSTSRPGDRRQRPLRLASLALLVIVGVLAAGCGGGGAGANSAADRERDAALKYAQCMREHGVDMPDPGTGDRLKVGPGEDLTPEELEEAEKACEKYKAAIEPPELSEQEQEESKEGALANARCMREHGIENFPDPTFDESGSAEIPIGPDSGIDPEDPDFQEAEKACQDTLPQPSAETTP